MLESEPQDLTSDNEGDDEAHRPIWYVAPQDPDGHSPHFDGPSLTGDHVIDLEPGARFYSAQWHLHLVFNENGAHAESVDGDPLTNADIIRDNAGDGEPLTIVPVDFVITCPVRPHKHGRS